MSSMGAVMVLPTNLMRQDVDADPTAVWPEVQRNGIPVSP